MTSKMNLNVTTGTFYSIISLSLTNSHFKSYRNYTSWVAPATQTASTLQTQTTVGNRCGAVDTSTHVSVVLINRCCVVV